ncbi:MAG: transglutaminase-like domain-containing protein, partial [Bacilli bacterium]|nr:transglutaminase-like domain-containing protein [Bacilli bacterium]
MIKLTSFNKNFFSKHKKITLAMACVIGVTVATLPSDIHLPDFEKAPCYCFVEQEPSGVDRYIWSDYSNDLVDTLTLTYYPADSYKIKVFRGSSSSNYYRILVNDNPYRYSKWQEIPENDLITICHDDYDSQYGNKFMICFGTYNLETGEIEEDNRHSILETDARKEQVEKFNSIREKAVDDVKKIVQPNDSDFEKVKKGYDYVISHFAYFHNFDGHDFNDGVYQDVLGVWYLDCAGYADILNSIFENIGIESLTTVDDTHGHVWNIVKVDNT